MGPATRAGINVLGTYSHFASQIIFIEVDHGYKKNKKPASLFDELKEGLESAIQLEQGKRVRSVRAVTVTITPVRKRSLHRSKIYVRNFV